MAERGGSREQSLEQMFERLSELENRVALLEKGERPPVKASVRTFLGDIPKDKVKQAKPTSVVPVLGKAVLAIAGAYLLRAVAESGAAPRSIMLIAGIVYAAAWLVWAVRSHRTSHFASVIFALTAALILPPLLWEGTVRFQVLSAGFAAAVLVGAVVLSLSLAWKESLEVIPWIGTVAAVGTAIALIIATHELRALTMALLAMALVTEVAASSGRWLSLRVVTALGADFGVGIIGLLMTSAEGVPQSYRPMGAGEINMFCMGLMLIYGGTVAVRAFVMKRELTITELLQAGVTFILGTWVSSQATHGGSSAALGTMFLLLALVCYWGALKRFAGIEMRRNRRVSALYAVGLVLAGSSLLLNRDLRVVVLCLAAIAAVALFMRTKYLSLGIHGTFYLLMAGVQCGLFGYAAAALAGTVPAWPGWSFWMVALTGVVTYALGSRVQGDGWRARVLWVVPAAVVGSTGAALVVAGIVRMGAGDLSASRLSMVRTVVTCVMALVLGYMGSRWKRVELGWLAYGAIGLGALKLVLEDLRFGNAGTLMVSLLFYGLILILLPRLTQFGRVEV